MRYKKLILFPLSSFEYCLDIRLLDLLLDLLFDLLLDLKQ